MKIVGYTLNGAAYCVRHKPDTYGLDPEDQAQPIFSTDEGWQDMTCDMICDMAHGVSACLERLEDC